VELARINKSHSWLAKKLGLSSRQALDYYLKLSRPYNLKKMAEILGVDPKDLIK
jgi:hypothetical protein